MPEVHPLVRQLTRIRKSRGISQVEMAKLMDTNKSYLAYIEVGRHSPTLVWLDRYAKALGLGLVALNALPAEAMRGDSVEELTELPPSP